MQVLKGSSEVSGWATAHRPKGLPDFRFVTWHFGYAVPLKLKTSPKDLISEGLCPKMPSNESLEP